MSNKFLIGIAAAFFAVFAIGIGAVMGITRLTDRTTISDVNSSSPSDAIQVSAPAATSVQTLDAPAAPATPASAPVATVAQPTGIAVSDSDINQLAVAVKLGRDTTGAVSKDVWAKETPLAEKLLNGMCDCDQRNWLNHFVKTGKEAASGSEDFPQSVQLLASLRRSNNDLTSNQTPH